MKIDYKWFARKDVIIGLIASLILTVGSWVHWLPYGNVDVAAFISGALCVWLLVKNNIWNWPVGIVNAGLFVVLFYNGRLYADAALNALYIVLGIWGWYYWTHMNKQKTQRPITRGGILEQVIVVAIGAVATYFISIHLTNIKDGAPFWDALTTAISLVATYLQARKFIENWWYWIMADVIYIPLYFAKHLPLTGVLYVLFLAMCVKGLFDWKPQLVKKEK